MDGWLAGVSLATPWRERWACLAGSGGGTGPGESSPGG